LRQNLEQENWDEMQGFGIPRMVCRNPGCVSHVLINGRLAVDDERIATELGHARGYGQFLAAR
ncbi:MAG: N-acyl-D-glutamate amidohydrolase, partial [Pseudomonadales bacterium]